jgi:hypothetical protein
MKAAWLALWILTLAAAFFLARLTAPGRERADLRSVDSFRAALAERDTLNRSYRLSAFLQEFGPDDVPAALEALEARSIGVSQEEVRLLMLAWSRFDAPGAFAWASDWPTRWRETLMTEAMYAWGFRDGRAAFRALEGVEDPELLARLRPAILEGWLRSDDREGVGEYIANIEVPRRRGRLTFVLAAETMRDGVEAVIRWAEAVPEDAPNDFKQSVFYHASTVVSREDPQRAVEWFEEHRTQPYSEGSVTGIAVQWARLHDPPGLFDWLRSLPAEGEREGERGDAIAEGFRIWLQRTPAEAEAWLRSALPDPELDPALGELVLHLSRSSPGSAVALAGRIQDEELRRERTIQAGRKWWRAEPEAVTSWLAESDLSEEVRQQIVMPRPTARAPAAARPALPQAE